MAEYIDRDAAIAACFDGFADCRDDCASNIRNIPAADVVARKTGKWISYIEDGYLECPFCGAATNCDGDESELHFCFSCGAKMIGGNDDV